MPYPTYSQPMYEAMIKDQVPDSISEFEILADHYQIGGLIVDGTLFRLWRMIWNLRSMKSSLLLPMAIVMSVKGPILDWQ